MTTGELDLVTEDARKRRRSDDLILQYATLSYNEIEQKTGIPATDVAVRLDELLNERDHLTQLQKEQLLIMDIQDVITDAKARMKNVSDEYYADIAAVVVRSFTAIGSRFDNMRKLIKHDISEITRARANLFGRAFDIALWHVLDKLMVEHPDISKQEVRALVREGMMMAQEELNRSVNDD